MWDKGCALQILSADTADEVFGVPDFAHGLQIAALHPFAAAGALEGFFWEVVPLLGGVCRYR